MTKRTYRAIPFQRVATAQFAQAVGDVRGVVSVDLAKRKIVASFADHAGQVGLTVRFEHPKETMAFVECIQTLASERPIDAVLEATGTYGDPIRFQLAQHGASVFSIAPKKVHDAAEVFDGVPSLHDAKACALITQLHVQGATRAYEPPDEHRRQMRALVDRREIYAGPHHEALGRIEAVLAKFWPRGLEVLDHWSRKSAIRLLERYPDPRLIQRDPEGARECLRKASRSNLTPQAIDAIIESAQHPVGQTMNDEERATLRELAAETLRLRDHLDRVDRDIKAKADEHDIAKNLATVVGSVSAAVLVAYLGDLGAYSCPAALEKACGLNLKIHQSGERKTGRLAISKRGPSIIRRYLYMSAMRIIQTEPLLRAWYQRRVSFKRGHKISALVAVMRKLIRAFWHVARGNTFDAAKLVDSRRFANNT